jgi:hypothetical protein
MTDINKYINLSQIKEKLRDEKGRQAAEEWATPRLARLLTR